MNTKDVIEFIEMQEKNLRYSENKISELESRIRQIQAFPKGWVMPNPLPVNLQKETYDIGEINTAFQRTITYEGLKSQGTVLNTFLAFLNKSHHSLNGD